MTINNLLHHISYVTMQIPFSMRYTLSLY